MSKFTVGIIASVLVLIASGAAQAAFTAYNDFGGAFDGGNVTQVGLTATGISWGAVNGNLLDFGTGADTGVNMAISVAADPSGGAITAGSAAYNYFNGKVNVDGYIFNNAPHPATITFSGLNLSQLYHVVLFGDAGVSTATNRNVYTILGTATASSFTNNSGGVLSGTNNRTATMMAGYNSIAGDVGDYTDIAPAADGTFEVKIGAVGGNRLWILNALMLETFGTATVGDVTPQSLTAVPEPATLALLALGLPLLRKRRR